MAGRRRWLTGVAEPPFRTDVIERAKRGDDEAIAMLYRNHVAVVHGYFRACGLHDADDLTSEVFVGMLRSLDGFEGGVQDFRSWLMTIAFRRMVDHRRRRSVDRSVPQDPVAVEAAAVEAGRRSELHALAIDPQLISAFGLLTDAQREVLALRFVADLGLESVAAITGRPLGAVKSMQHRGLAALRSAISTVDDELGGTAAGR